MGPLLDLLPVLPVREAWVVGLLVVLAVLRPVGRLGWTAATAVVAAAAATVLGVLHGDIDTGVGTDAVHVVNEASLVWATAVTAWIGLALLLGVAALARPLRWEPRTGPSAATALVFGALVVHAGTAWHRGGLLGEAAGAWVRGELDPDLLAGYSGAAGGPLAWVLSWPPSLLPFVSAPHGAALIAFGAAVATVLGADRLGRRWGNVGTARCIAAAVAWSPPLLLAHVVAPAALIATAALVWSWWALVEVWAGRHRPGRLASVSGLLLGIAGGVAVWPLVALPLWLRRLGSRTVGWFAAGLAAALLVADLALVPTAVGVGDAWEATVSGPAADGLLPPAAAAGVVIVALAALVVQRPLSPTRLSAATAAVLLLTVPWWPPGAEVAGPVTAIPFVLLASVAPDRPDERWPPDSALSLRGPEEVGA